MDGKSRLAIRPAALLLAALILPLPSACAQTRQEPRDGRGVYVAKGCYQCHGYEGQGSLRTGPPLAPVRLPREVFEAYVREPAGTMPPYSEKILSREDLDLIMAYLASRPEPKPPESIPLLAPYVKR